MFDEKTIRESRAQVWDGMAKIVSDAKLENRSLTESEAAEYDARSRELEKLDKDLERVRRHAELSSARKELADTRGQSLDESLGKADIEARAFAAYLKRGDKGVREVRAAEYDAGLNEGGFGPGGTYTAGQNGGYLVPQGFWDELTIAMKAYGGLLNVANVINTATGNPMNWPTTDPTAVKGSIVGEGVQDTFTNYTFGQGTLQAWTYTSGVILASLELINDSAFDVESFVRDRIAESIGRIVAEHLQTGNGGSSGGGQPLGIQTALAAWTAGLTASPVTGTAYDPTTGTGSGGVYTGAGLPAANTLDGQGSLIGFADVQGMINAVDPAYWDGAQFVASTSAIKALRNVTDNYGHPLWQPNVQVGGNDDIYGYSYIVDQETGPLTAGAQGGLLFGNFKRAMVVRRVEQGEVMRLAERYADARQVGFFGFMRLDARGNDLRAAVSYQAPAAIPSGSGGSSGS